MTSSPNAPAPPRPLAHVDCETETPNGWPVRLRVREHVLRADDLAASGDDSAPSPHDYFDAALAACKAMTATWFARKKGIALERVVTHVERDDAEERKGKYVLRVRLEYHGALSDDDRARLHDAVSRCPIHKLMTTTEVVIETAPLEASGAP